MKTFTIVAHKPESFDYCRGCVTETYSGGFEICHNVDAEKAIVYAAELLARPIRVNEVGFDICFMTVHEGQMLSFDQDGKRQSPIPEDESVEDRENLEKQIRAFVEALWVKVDSFIVRRVNEQIEREEREAAERKARQEADEREILRKLKEKYKA